jgi:hypothetical protein
MMQGGSLWSLFLAKIEETLGPVFLATVIGSRRYNLCVEVSFVFAIVAWLITVDTDFKFAGFRPGSVCCRTISSKRGDKLPTDQSDI